MNQNQIQQIDWMQGGTKPGHIIRHEGHEAVWTRGGIKAWTQEARSLMETRWRERLETVALGLETIER